MIHPPAAANICWPSEPQERLLRACFLPQAAARAEFKIWRSEITSGQLDAVSLRLLPILVRAGSKIPLDDKFVELGKRVHLAQWGQNRDRVASAASLQALLLGAGIECMFLKGIALLSRFYGDAGLRTMGDVDFLVRPEDAPAAMAAMQRVGWVAENNLPLEQLRSQMRVRHAWQFQRGEEEHCDMHWHAVVRCFNPSIGDAFWRRAEAVDLGAGGVIVPCATDQLFQVCAHGLQWSWTPQIRWIPDAMSILASTEPIEWMRLLELAVAAGMTVRIQAALQYLRVRMEAPIPELVIRMLAKHRPPRWERNEYRLLQKPCPLGPIDSARWHTSNFRRIRPFDAVWKSQPAWRSFPDYMRAFLGAASAREASKSLWRELVVR